MAIEKMKLVSVTGMLEHLDNLLWVLCQTDCFHVEHVSENSTSQYGFRALNETNPYADLFRRASDLSAEMSSETKYAPYDDLELDGQEAFDGYLTGLEESLARLTQKRKDLSEKIAQHEQTLVQLNHLAGLNVTLDEIFECQYVKVRFGRLPYDSYPKLAYYDDKTFFFVPFDHDDDYYWGVYFAPLNKIAVIDDVFKSLYFERMRVPDYAHGTPEKAMDHISAELETDRKLLNDTLQQIEEISGKESATLQKVYCKLKFLNDTFEMRKNVSVLNGKFYLVGFVPEKQSEAFAHSCETVYSVSVVIKPYDADQRLTPPVKLKNSWFARPFEMFVKMYGLPSYHEIDPTAFVAVTYTLLFGIMFGDLGQGLLISIIGMLVYKWKKLELGRIMTRIGISSACFGVLYGSVFGFEDLLDPLYQNLFGLEGKPIDVLAPDTTTFILLVAVAIGVVLIVICIALNIYLGFKQKDFTKALFGQNGIAGILLYVGVIFAVVMMLVFHVDVLNPVFIIVCIVLPLIAMFLREPLSKLCKKRKDLKPKDGIGGFIIENFFELFEFMLSFVTNTMSFLRVGGFVLSHAGMMMVVFTLAESLGSVGSPVMIVFGNLFVMAMEGLIVGIQVLRLEFYEIFSRFFEGNGKPFVPLKVHYENEE